ncbi:hypothetical protein [Paenibacillus puerhi]|uniref:hypothetical protein n=1 Tax=Paenibacillus puerhi TaxID=2692622 RepID=UPI00135C6298|nr:hypothetical protein [Paenibacillus puerhi]
MFALQLGGQQLAWDSFYILTLFLVFAIFFVLFIIAEKKAAEPIISFQMFANRAFTTGNILMVLYGVIL